MSVQHVRERLKHAASEWVRSQPLDLDALYSTVGNEFLHEAEAAYFAAGAEYRKRLMKVEGQALPDRAWGVYQLIDREGRVLYVGMTGRPKARVRQHIREFGERIAYVEFQRFGSRVEAYDAETALIQEIQPPMNLAKVPL